MADSKKDDYGRMVCFFLAEGLRTRKISLERSAEIAEKVLAHYNLLDTERDFLELVRELSKDFEELAVLEKKVEKNRDSKLTRAFEDKVREYAISIMASDTKKALEILEAASKDQVNFDHLLENFPDFKTFTEKHG